jgi:hypothetical protein
MLGSESEDLQACRISNPPKCLNGYLDDVGVVGFPSNSGQVWYRARLPPHTENPGHPSGCRRLGMVKGSDQLLDIILFKGKALHVYLAVRADPDIFTRFTPTQWTVKDHPKSSHEK